MNVKAIPLYLSADEILSLYNFLDDLMHDYLKDKYLDDGFVLILGQNAFAQDTYVKLLYGVDELVTKVL